MTENDTHRGGAEAPSMGTRLWRLLELETAKRKSGAGGAEHWNESEILELRREIPRPLMQRFDFRMERGIDRLRLSVKILKARADREPGRVEGMRQVAGVARRRSPNRR